LAGKSIFNILVYGWYNKGNIGDNLFEEAFKQIFPELNFQFVDEITKESLTKSDAVFFGGGSFLFSEPLISPDLLPLLKSKKIFYIGVGAETEIEKTHKELLKLAKLICIRSNDLEKIQTLNHNAMIIPDIVYSLATNSYYTATDNSVLILPNATVIPTYKDDHWKHASWNYFKCEFAQFVDSLIETGHKIKFLPMCDNKHISDVWAIYEIISHMIHRSNVDIVYHLDQFDQCQTIVTQRYHGIILAQLARKHYISIHHHDKLKDSLIKEGEYIPYYGINKDGLIKSFYKLKKEKLSNTLPIDYNLFSIMKAQVINLLQNG
jgi:polysaccharide pyruvyl transferase WcaK-like protein